MLDYTYKSLNGSFPRPLTDHNDRAYSRFGKTWTQIIEDLAKELRQLKYRQGSCVIMTAHTPYDVRNDGRLRADARKPEHPGVVVKFDVWDDTTKRYVPMSFECDNFTDYQANIQAIAGAMEALRKVDRYAVSGGGRTKAHYDGYKALPSAEGRFSTQEDAAAFIATHSGVSMQEILNSETARATAFRKAVRTLHPDSGGSHEEFVKLIEAKKTFTFETA
jgi:hypothetical protein